MARRGSRALLFLAGLAAGMLFSPNTGRANRAKIKDKANHYSNVVEDLFLVEAPRKFRYYRGKLTGIEHKLEKSVLPELHGAHARMAPDDITLTDKIKSLIGRPTEGIDDSAVNINTVNGIVYLRGAVPSNREKRRIERVARMQQGTRDVENDLKIAA